MKSNSSAWPKVGKCGKCDLVVSNLPANAGDMSSIPTLGWTTPGQLSPCATTTEPVLSSQHATTAKAGAT